MVKEKSSKKPAQIFQFMPLRGRQPPSTLQTKKHYRTGQGNQIAKDNDFQGGIITAHPFDSDILQGKDEHRQDKETDAFYIGTHF